MGGRKDLAEGVIRCVPGEDKTNGFFVACFVKKGGMTLTGKEGKGSKKRSREDQEAQAEKEEQSDGDVEATKDASGVPAETSAESREKTEAQIARKKRKKAQQKARKQA